MFMACGEGHLSVCRWLVEVGAAEDIRKSVNNSYTPMCAASLRGHLSVMKYLILNSALNRPVSDTEKESDAAGHIDQTIFEHDVQPSHRPALFDWAQKLLSSHTLFVDVVLPASIVLRGRRMSEDAVIVHAVAAICCSFRAGCWRCYACSWEWRRGGRFAMCGNLRK